MDKLKKVLGGRETEEETGIIGTVSTVQQKKNEKISYKIRSIGTNGTHAS